MKYTTHWNDGWLSFLEDGKAVMGFAAHDMADYLELRAAWEAGEISWNKLKAIIEVICS